MQLCDDHALVRSGLRRLLETEPDLSVVGESANADEVVERVGVVRPDVLLLDVVMPGRSGIEVMPEIRDAAPGTRILMLSMQDDPAYVRHAFAAGASGYVLKDSPSDQLVTAIREVQRGGSYLSPRLLTRLVDGFRVQGRNAVRQPRFGTLTKREREILKMLAEGKSVKEIATGFDLSVKTVEAHKFNLMRKLDIHNKAQLVQYAIQKKVIRLMEPVTV